MARSLRILLVDDQFLIRRAMEEYLRHLGYLSVDHVANGIEAQALLLDRHNAGIPFDIVFTDRVMPVMDGMALLQACRTDPRFDHTAFVMLSGESEAASIVQALACGATSYMIKPVTAEHFRRTIAAVVEWLDRTRDSPPAHPMPTPDFATASQLANSALPAQEMR